MKRAILCACTIGVASCATAQFNDQLERCTTLSFAPLDVNVPACTALLGDAEAFDESTLAAIYVARAEAYEFGITYHGDRDVRADELLALAIEDLSAAISVTSAPAARSALHLRRAQLREGAGDTDGAITDYRAVLDADPGHQAAMDALQRLQANQE
jgi:hypothetical protein